MHYMIKFWCTYSTLYSWLTPSREIVTVNLWIIYYASNIYKIFNLLLNKYIQFSILIALILKTISRSTNRKIKQDPSEIQYQTTPTQQFDLKICEHGEQQFPLSHFIFHPTAPTWTNFEGNIELNLIQQEINDDTVI